MVWCMILHPSNLMAFWKLSTPKLIEMYHLKKRVLLQAFVTLL